MKAESAGAPVDPVGAEARAESYSAEVEREEVMYRRKTLQGTAKEVGLGETVAARSPEGEGG